MSVRERDERTKGFLTQHPLYFLRIHSRARSCALEMSAGVIFFATESRNLAPNLYPFVAAIFPHIWAKTQSLNV